MNEAKVYGVVSVSDKGQIALPIIMRRQLNIQKGDKLMVIKRDDNAGFTFIKLSLMDKVLDKISKKEDLSKSAGGTPCRL